jgi:hypothetical protein
MVVLYAARHRLAVPALARWLLALGIVATMAANVAHGWPGGPIGAAVAAWPAASLVGSYELLLWLIRTSADGAVAREPVAGQAATGPRLALVPSHEAPAQRGTSEDDWTGGKPDGSVGGLTAWTDRTSGSDRTGTGPAYRRMTDWPTATEADILAAGGQEAANSAAVAAYRTSVSGGKPLSERKLAAMFGKTSRRWARNRMAEAQQTAGLTMTENP